MNSPSNSWGSFFFEMSFFRWRRVFRCLGRPSCGVFSSDSSSEEALEMTRRGLGMFWKRFLHTVAWNTSYLMLLEQFKCLIEFVAHLENRLHGFLVSSTDLLVFLHQILVLFLESLDQAVHPVRGLDTQGLDFLHHSIHLDMQTSIRSSLCNCGRIRSLSSEMGEFAAFRLK